MSVAHNQLRIARELWTRLQPLNRGVPARLQTLLADRRFGSRDRRLYRELLFTALREARALAALPADADLAWAARLAATCAATRETEAFRATFTDPCASAAGCKLDLVPTWFPSECETATGHPDAASLAAALLERAPVWVRLQTDNPDAVFAEWSARGWIPGPHPALTGAYKLPPETNLTACPAYQAGHYEIQDLGSQLILASLDLPACSPGPRWLDVCAGAGGKTLQLARLLGSAARIDASDIRPAALVELSARASRAGLGDRVRAVKNTTRAGSPPYDGVLVDAPCSGSGTWRRAPYLMACTSVADLGAAAELQTRILAEASAHVRAGGLLVYATCSIACRENEAVVAAFLASPEGRAFTVAPPANDFGFPRTAHGLALVPGREDNDGFYVSALRRAAA